MSMIRARFAGVILAFGLSSTLLGAAGTVNATDGESAAAARQRAAQQCGSGGICLWRERGFSGESWRWTPRSGYRDVPSHLHDHAYSFYADAEGCFVDWDPKEKRRVNVRDYAKAYDTNFGKRINAVDFGGSCS